MPLPSRERLSIGICASERRPIISICFSLLFLHRLARRFNNRTCRCIIKTARKWITARFSQYLTICCRWRCISLRAALFICFILAPKLDRALLRNGKSLIFYDDGFLWSRIEFVKSQGYRPFLSLFLNVNSGNCFHVHFGFVLCVCVSLKDAEITIVKALEVLHITDVSFHNNLVDQNGNKKCYFSPLNNHGRRRVNPVTIL